MERGGESLQCNGAGVKPAQIPQPRGSLSDKAVRRAASTVLSVGQNDRGVGQEDPLLGSRELVEALEADGCQLVAGAERDARVAVDGNGFGRGREREVVAVVDADGQPVVRHLGGTDVVDLVVVEGLVVLVDASRGEDLVGGLGHDVLGAGGPVLAEVLVVLLGARSAVAVHHAELEALVAGVELGAVGVRLAADRVELDGGSVDQVLTGRGGYGVHGRSRGGGRSLEARAGLGAVVVEIARALVLRGGPESESQQAEDGQKANDEHTPAVLAAVRHVSVPSLLESTVDELCLFIL